MAFGTTPGLTDLGGSSNETPSEQTEGMEQQAEGAEQTQESWEQQVSSDSQPEQEAQQQEQQHEEPDQPEEQQETVSNFMRDYGLNEEQVVSAMKEYMYLASPEGMEQFKATQREQVEKLVADRRNDTIKEGLRELLSNPQGQQVVEHLLSKVRGEQGSFEQNAEGSNPQMQQLMSRLNNLEQQNRQLLEQINGGSQQQELQQWQQKWEGEYEGFFKQHPNASRYQKELAGELREAIDANPQAYKREGAATFKLRSLLAKFNRIAGSNEPAPRVPAGRPSGGGMVSRSHGKPKSQQALLKSILTDIDGYGGG